MKMRIIAPLLAALLITLTVWADDAKPDQDAMQGTWRVTKLIVLGQEVDRQTLSPVRFIVDENRLAQVNLYPSTQTATFVLDPKSVPKAIDLMTKMPDGTTAKGLGIYTIHGDDMAFCIASEAGRPVDFKPTKQNMVIELKREP